MHLYRVTKYNSAFRDRFDSYTRDEWTGRHDVGSTVAGHTLTEDEYQVTENKYLYALEAFAQESGVRQLTLEDLYKGPATPPQWQHLQEGDTVSLDQALDLARLMLREGPLTTLLIDDDRFYAHVGDNMYMWIGSVVDCVNAVAEAERIGLYVDYDKVSPLHDDGERYWWLTEGAPVRHILMSFDRATEQTLERRPVPDGKVDALRGMVNLRADDAPFYETYDVDDARIPELAAILGADLDPRPYYRLATESVKE